MKKPFISQTTSCRLPHAGWSASHLTRPSCPDHTHKGPIKPRTKSALITIGNGLILYCSLFFLLAFAPASHGDTATAKTTEPDSIADSLLITQKRDSLLRMESQRREAYLPGSLQNMGAQAVTSDELFCSDATSWNDVATVRRRSVVPRMGIANGLNRLLPYGNSAPLNRIYQGTELLFGRADEPACGDDFVFATEYSHVITEADGSVHYHPMPTDLVSPEAVLFWENGVFDENILTVRFTRPFARNLMVNVFSNYRHFKGTQFSHDGNDVYTFYSKLTKDSTILSHRGYNPLVYEYSCGADAVWSGERANSFFRVKYGDYTSELPIDRITEDDSLDYARLTQYPLSLQSGFSLNRSADSRLFLNVEAQYRNNPQRWTRSAVDSSASVHTQSIGINSNDLAAAVRGGIRVIGNDSAAAQFTVKRRQTGVDDSLDIRTFQYRPEMVWIHPVALPFLDGFASVQWGYDIHTGKEDSTLVYAPVWSAKINAAFDRYRLNLFVERDNLHYQPVFDSLATNGTLHDRYIRTGIDMEGSWRAASLLVGYQWCTPIDYPGIERAWLSQAPPYEQPQSVLIIAPSMKRWKGVELSSRVMLSEKRPFVKMNGSLSLLIFPHLTNEAIDLRLNVDYWSERDQIRFAGHKISSDPDTIMFDDWSREILDINVVASVQIKSFRLNYKIDNLLNRNFAYIPGYRSPGITFRWGFSWFIQR